MALWEEEKDLGRPRAACSIIIVITSILSFIEPQTSIFQKNTLVSIVILDLFVYD